MTDRAAIAGSLRYAIRQTAEWLRVRQPGYKAAIPDVVPGYDDIRGEFAELLFDAFMDYAGSGGAVTRWRNAAGRVVIDGVSNAFYRGYKDAGGEETENDDEQWLTARQSAELGHLPGVFEWIKQARDAEPPTITEDAVQGRVDGWASSLDSIYAEGQLRGAKNRMLTWHLGATEEHCKTCLKLDGKRHSAKWYLARDYIPRKPDAAMDCGGWNCDCQLVSDDGEEVTL